MYRLTNFFEETFLDMQCNGYKPNDVVFIGSLDGKYRMSWDKFKYKGNFYYDRSLEVSGGVAKDLIVCFKDGSYLGRFEDDGAEWWVDMGKTKLNYKEDDLYSDFNILGGKSYTRDTVENMNKNEKEVSPNYTTFETSCRLASLFRL